VPSFRARIQQRRPASGSEGREIDARSDDAVLAAAARVQPEAFTFLYDRYAPQVYSYCYLKLGDREAAEDAMSEVFLKALTDLGQYRGGAFGGWLFRIAQYTVADIHRSRRRRGPALPIDAADDVAGSDMPLDEWAGHASELDRLRAALAQLPADQRAVLEFQLADLSPQEIAAALRRSLNAVRLLRLRAMRAVRPLLEEPLADAPETRRVQA
jgi:RNA polymerase sigma-70 factor (ECF subfamily)